MEKWIDTYLREKLQENPEYFINTNVYKMLEDYVDYLLKTKCITEK